MTVGNLMEMLEKYPEDTIVRVFCTYDSGFCTTGGDVTEILDDANGFVEIWNTEW